MIQDTCRFLPLQLTRVYHNPVAAADGTNTCQGMLLVSCQSKALPNQLLTVVEALSMPDEVQHLGVHRQQDTVWTREKVVCRRTPLSVWCCRMHTQGGDSDTASPCGAARARPGIACLPQEPRELAPATAALSPQQPHAPPAWFSLAQP